MTAAIDRTHKVTIDISVPFVVHLTIGVALAAAALAAFIVYTQIDHEFHQRGVVLGGGIVAATLAIAYWLWCCMQRLRAEHVDLAAAITEATGAVEALQECYTREGTLLLLPETKEEPRD
jgi:hypothetical protein